jgi:hypothetical protein
MVIQRILRDDSTFLCSHQIMDYSLLVGVHRTVYQHDRDTLQVELERRADFAATFAHTAHAGASSPSFMHHHVRQHSSASTYNSSDDLLRGDSTQSPTALAFDINKAYVPSEFEAPVAFYFGVIDILQRWSWKKVVERWLKMGVKCLDGDGLSAVEPVTYQDRFTRRVIDVVVRSAVSPSKLVLEEPRDERPGAASAMRSSGSGLQGAAVG